jgi:hypothetical protein
MSNEHLAFARPADLNDAAAESFRSQEIAHALSVASDLDGAEPCAEGPGEVVAGSLAALAYLVRVGSATRSETILAECEVIYRRTRRQLGDWRVAAGCEDWSTADWSRGEVQAVAECEGALAGLRARLLAFARETSPATAERLAA